MHWKIALLCLVLICFANPVMGFAGGEGTAEDPYQISNIVELQKMNEYKSSHFVLVNNINADVTRDWNGGSGFFPVGNINDEFSGSLDGDGYFIDGLYINYPTITRVGLFGFTKKAVIKNLSITNGFVVGYSSTAGIVGHGIDTNIYSSSFEGRVQGKILTSGIIAYGVDSSVYNSCSAGKVNSDVMGAAGLVSWGENVIIENSYSTADILTTGKGAAGLVAYANDMCIITSYASGRVTGQEDIAGLVANSCISTIVESSFYDSDVSGQNDIGKGIPKSTFEMNEQDTFRGWDFDNIWYMDKYPKLIFQTSEVVQNILLITGLEDIEAGINETVFIDVDYITNQEGNDILFTCNRTDLFINFDTVTGEGTWLTNPADVGVHEVLFIVSSGTLLKASQTIIIAVIDDAPELWQNEIEFIDLNETEIVNVNDMEFVNLNETEFIDINDTEFFDITESEIIDDIETVLINNTTTEVIDEISDSTEKE